jgi:hypothetical protein
MIRICVAFLGVICTAIPAGAGTLVCALYGPDGKIQEVFIPDDDRACDHLDDENLNQIRLPLSLWKYDRSLDAATHIAADMQQIVSDLVKHAHEDR